MKLFMSMCVVLSLLAVGCGQPEQKPLSQDDKAKMMDRSDVPQGYLEANKARMGQSGPVTPPAQAGTTGGQ